MEKQTNLHWSLIKTVNKCEASSGSTWKLPEGAKNQETFKLRINLCGSWGKNQEEEEEGNQDKKDLRLSDSEAP